jgi:Nod factor-specific ABC transporter NodJ protein
MNIAFDWYPVFLREMLLFRRKLLHVSYLVSAMVTPFIYLLTFGFGLGGSIRVQGQSYLAFLVPGLVAMTSMNNSYSWVATNLNLNRLYLRTFQVFVQAPIRAGSILLGEVLAAMVKGLFASVLIVIIGYIAGSFSMSPAFLIALLVNCFLFANLGVIVGMRSKSHEDTGTYSNFLIMPMAFLSGTFFQVDRVPGALKAVIYVLPLTHTNILIRKAAMDQAAWCALAVLCGYSVLFTILAWVLIRRYNE